MITLLEKYHPPGSDRHAILIQHSRLVASKAMTIGRRISTQHPIDLQFIEEAALLHDIGIHLTDAPTIGCYGKLPYLAHGYLGRALLEEESLPRHALVCERHIGVGLSRDEIIEQSLPLPHRDIIPCSMEEKIIAYADLFYSKSDSEPEQQRTIEEVREKMSRFGLSKVSTLNQWHQLFSE